MLNGRFYWLFTELCLLILRKFSSLTSRKTYFTDGSHDSDSEATSYLKSIRSILNRESDLVRFRRKLTYREILEHLSFHDGLKYLERIENLASREDAFRVVSLNTANDSFGLPITFKYAKYGRINPTTLRYIATALDISREISILPAHSVVEIGCGYGGQASVINRIFGVSNYTCFDLDPVLDLVQIYLKMSNSNLEIQRGELTNPSSPWDIAISNYAFSELKRELQIDYLEKVLTKCNSGYMIMNSGGVNKTGRSKGKLSIDEIREYLPNLKVKDEIPLTGPDNYVIHWRLS